MSGLDDIPISIVQLDDNEGGLRENVRAILQEIATMLESMLETGTGLPGGEVRAIDIRSLPLLPGDYDALEAALGTGEISAEFDGGYGPTEIFETGVPGVWWLKHFNEAGEIAAEFIEIARIPEILLSQEDDIHDGLEHLRERLRDPQNH